MSDLAPYHTEAAPTVVPILQTRLLPFELEGELRAQLQQIAALDQDIAGLDIQLNQLREQRNALYMRRSRHDALCMGLRTTLTHITGRPLSPELLPAVPRAAADDYDEVPF